MRKMKTTKRMKKRNNSPDRFVNPGVDRKVKALPSTLEGCHTMLRSYIARDSKNYLMKMVNMQYSLMKKLNLLPSNKPLKRRKEIGTILTQITHEVEECRDHLDWKPHKNYTDFEFNESAFIGELTDIMFFVLELYIHCDCTSPDIYSEYKSKYNKNLNRKEFKYGAQSP